MDSFNDLLYEGLYSYENYNYSSLLTLTQSFIDIVRNSGGNNIDKFFDSFWS